MAKKKNYTTKPDNRNMFKFLQKSYDESFFLLVQARDYFSNQGKVDKANLTKDQQYVYSLAISTITTQLTSIMSWLLLCKAIEEGEITASQVHSNDFCIPEFSFGINEDDPSIDVLNKKSRELLEKSYNLYNRMKRMEGSIREQLLDMD